MIPCTYGYVARSFEVYLCTVYNERRTRTSAYGIVLGRCSIYVVDTQGRRQGYGFEESQGLKRARARVSPDPEDGAVVYYQ